MFRPASVPKRVAPATPSAAPVVQLVVPEIPERGNADLEQRIAAQVESLMTARFEQMLSRIQEKMSSMSRH